MATKGQKRAISDRISEANFSFQETQLLLERWNYVLALVRAPEKLPSIEVFKQFLTGKLEMVAPIPWNAIWDDATDKNWLDWLVEREAAVHKLRGTQWRRDLFIETAKKYGRAKIQMWECVYLLRFSAWPILDLSSNSNLDWWQIRPSRWYYDQLRAKKIGRLVDGQFQPDTKAQQLHGEIVLIDTRLKPVLLRNDKQMWQSDDFFCGKILKQLRRAGIISCDQDCSQKSRFGVSADDWQKYIWPALAQHIGLEPNQLRFEGVIEGSVTSQFYPDLPRTQEYIVNTSVWYEEWYEDTHFRLHGGANDDRLFISVSFCSSNLRYSSRSFRPLGVLARA
ncbi:MAG: hypothetical protein ABII72_05050 [Parcubacteria group bacterium]